MFLLLFNLIISIKYRYYFMSKSMKKILFFLLITLTASVSFGQDLPENPETGKCYVRCKTPDVYKNESVQLAVSPEYRKIVAYPAEYKTIQEKVLIKEAGEEIRIIPAV